MEVVVRVEESEQGCIQDCGKPSSESATLKQVADPVVYKLVRVDFDGKLVPATDNELWEVENLLELEKDEIVSMSDDFDTIRHGLDKDGSNNSQYKGLPQINIDEADEDRAKPHLEDSFFASDLNTRICDLAYNVMDGSDVEDGSNKNGSAGSRPNFSMSKGEINLDKLTIRELQETFRATFGRETSIKDKMWLKRRIAMGLTNSCDVAVTSFVINDGKLLNKTGDFCNTVVCEDSLAGEACSVGDDMSANSGSHVNRSTDMEDGVTFRNSLADSGFKSDDSLEHRAAKRVRKPTKRYIEELSDKETNNPVEKSISPSKRNEDDKFSLSSAIKTTWSVNTGALLTRRDSFGGSGVQVPYVSRVRRCRPRQNIMTLSNFESSDGAALTSTVVENSDAPKKSQSDTSSEAKAKLLDIKSVPCEDPIASEDLVEKQSAASMSDSSQDREPKATDSRSCSSRDNVAGDNSGTNSDDNVATVPTAKGGMRRKHHRAWTLTEVVKLVDGVSRFGPGRWSEIKRLSFSSYSYRTAVDLKDKWRNLLKASFSSLPADKGVNPRTKAPLPIPYPILVKVRELAEMNGQTYKVSKDNVCQLSNVNENR
ncbi:hypothetical protein RND81_04G141200 [Saponaria officinalis]|uniref:Uncharacterized protein n=1 Tax=Saponaria officinalis TaxID=3572 RepID=A0AAW1LLV1_SAPOF